MRISIITTLLAILIISCSSKKEIKSTKIERFDSIVFKEHLKIFPTITDTVWLDNPCDSSGNLKPFNQVFSTAKGKVTLEGKDGKISTRINLIGDTISRMSLSEISKLKSLSSTDTTKEKQPWLLQILLAASIALNFVQFFRKKPD